jgi:hypothetical protein
LAENFDDADYLPKSVWVQDYAGRRYTKRCGRKMRGRIEELAGGAKLRDMTTETKA